MKKILSITLLTIFAISYSQAQTFAPEGSKWTFCEPPFFGQPGGRIFVEVDESFSYDGKVIKTILHRNYYTTGDTTFLFHKQDSSFTLLYNFSFNVGDTFVIKNTPYSSNFIEQIGVISDSSFLVFEVDSVSILELNVENLKYYRTKFKEFSTDLEQALNEQYKELVYQVKFEFIEKIGMTTAYPEKFIPKISVGFAIDMSEPKLLHFGYENADTLYFDESISCPGIFSLDRIDDEISIQVFPNPAENFINIVSEGKSLDYFRLYSIDGKIIFESKIRNEIETVNISHLKPGLYFLKITDKNNKSSSIKILKQ